MTIPLRITNKINARRNIECKNTDSLEIIIGKILKRKFKTKLRGETEVGRE